ncbi:hypothetical protein AX14_012715 [Amanita brunnescens Koide BX004]|nr:hypothetical protein AX14_012715 [Amanita brunnescens Koide BX004]
MWRSCQPILSPKSLMQLWSTWWRATGFNISSSVESKNQDGYIPRTNRVEASWFPALTRAIQQNPSHVISNAYNDTGLQVETSNVKEEIPVVAVVAAPATATSTPTAATISTPTAATISTPTTAISTPTTATVSTSTTATPTTVSVAAVSPTHKGSSTVRKASSSEEGTLTFPQGNLAWHLAWQLA